MEEHLKTAIRLRKLVFTGYIFHVIDEGHMVKVFLIGGYFFLSDKF